MNKVTLIYNLIFAIFMQIKLSGCVIVNDKDEVLLLWKNNRQHFELPGGKVEVDEDIKTTAIRECKEEIGVDVIIKKYLGYEDLDIDGTFFQSHKFTAVIKQGQEPIVNEPEAFEKLFWMPLKKYTEYICAPNVKSFCQKYVNGIIKLV